MVEEFVFNKLIFDLPFYFWYVDDTILCVPLDKLKTIIDGFKRFLNEIYINIEIQKIIIESDFWT